MCGMRVGMLVQNDARDTLGMLGATISVKWKDGEKNEAGVELSEQVLGLTVELSRIQLLSMPESPRTCLRRRSRCTGYELECWCENDAQDTIGTLGARISSLVYEETRLF